MYTLLVIDMQPGFLQRFDDYNNYGVKEEVIQGVQERVVQAIADGAEIIDVNYTDRDGLLGDTIPEIADLWKRYKQLFKRRFSKVMKDRDGGGSAIMQNGVAEDEIRVCGINAAACVCKTVYELNARMTEDQKILVLTDAVANAWSDDCYSDIEYMQELSCVEVV